MKQRTPIVPRKKGRQIVVRVAVDPMTHPALYHHLSVVPGRQRAESMRLIGEHMLRSERESNGIKKRVAVAPPVIPPPVKPSRSAAFSAGVGTLLGSVDATGLDRADAAKGDDSLHRPNGGCIVRE
jgi:hypothetical protein